MGYSKGYNGPAHLYGGEVGGGDPLPCLQILQSGQNQKCKGEPGAMWVGTFITP